MTTTPHQLLLSSRQVVKHDRLVDTNSICYFIVLFSAGLLAYYCRALLHPLCWCIVCVTHLCTILMSHYSCRAAPDTLQAAYATQNPTPESILSSSSSSSSLVTAITSPAALSNGLGAWGGDVPLGATAGSGTSDSVITKQGNEFNNRYVPSVGSAISSK